MEIVLQRAIPFFWDHSPSPQTIWDHAQRGDFGPSFRKKGRDIITYHTVAEVERSLGKLTPEKREEGLAMYFAAFTKYRPPIVDIDPSLLVEHRPRRDPAAIDQPL